MRVFDVAELAGMSPKMVLEVYGHAVVDARLQDVANKRFA
jgi:hypothetical protein